MTVVTKRPDATPNRDEEGQYASMKRRYQSLFGTDIHWEENGFEDWAKRIASPKIQTGPELQPTAEKHDG